ncbi:MAG: hypothetical protein JWM38_2249 [Sphingomonas bacterium]|nr:hypothetical protein [Sphingomonas bacterium]MDB5718822.1 hypothetical protein [Sphingomonas bacterium]
MSVVEKFTTPGPERSLRPVDRASRLLGWFSLGLGIAQLVAPEKISKAIGLEGKEGVLRAFGGREIATGVGALSFDPELGMWGRVAGDVLDLATLATARPQDDQQRMGLTIAVASVAAITLLDIVTAAGLRAANRRPEQTALIDYADRSGFPKGLAKARGAARDLIVPADMRAAPAVA